ncbi:MULTISPECIES: GNAT family N-acetyltransferase [Paraburkholderia]|uniref:GNAT family N-acetyltransferase n=1 Tax=Paraburkholderia TaxID=1822464 RepID=UPI000841931A|nr:GNAT family N-acetyltransferase [Paraburkholderia nodosa]
MKESAVVVTVRREDPATRDAGLLLDELSAMVALYCGDGAQSRFNEQDAMTPRGAFVIARTTDGQAIGCGALRRFSFEVAEFKRIYRRAEFHGAGAAILRYLEELAAAMDFRRVILQTREANRRAIAFYRRHGYQHIDPYGEYTTMSDARCFGKALPVKPQP